MAHPKEEKIEKVIDLEEWGMSIWKGHPDALREQDKNARVMDKNLFDRLKSNISKEKRLESLPLCAKRNDRFEIVSGHHRIRAARMAGLDTIFWICPMEEMTKGQIKSKQLAHNAIEGEDDLQTLREIYLEIEDLELRMETGINPLDLDIPEMGVIKNESLDIMFDYKQVTLLFLPSGCEKFLTLLDHVSEDIVGVAPREEYEKIAIALRKVSACEDIRNLTAVFQKIAEIVEIYYNAMKDDSPQQIIKDL